jgi:L-galactose dehydrogenase
MEYRTLGRTGLEVSLVSYGSGGPSKLGQSTGLTDGEQDALVRRCLDLGVNLIDSAAGYGNSEEILGRALDGVPRDSYIMATKWPPKLGDGLKDDPNDLLESTERSLARLRTDCIDIMQVHGVRAHHYAELVERFYPTMQRLQEQGKVRFIGITEQFFADPKHEAMTLALQSHPELWDTVMLKYGILNQYAEKETLPLAMEHNVGVMNMAAVRVKLTRPDELEQLMAEWKERELIPADSLPEKDPLGWLVGGDVDSVVSAGYKFGADHPAIATVITGTSRIENLETNVAALEDPTLPAEDTERLIELFGDLAEPV